MLTSISGVKEVKLDVFEGERMGSASKSADSMDRLRAIDKLSPASPSLERRRIVQELEMKAEKYDNEYNSCCTRTGKTDKRLIQYASKFTMSVIILTFAGYQIMTIKPNDGLLPWYTSLVTMIMTVWIKTKAEEDKN